MRRSLLVSLVGTVLVVGVALAATVAAGHTPQLGLDLQGGFSVVLQPDREVDDDVLDQTIEIIRSRVDALGVAEPDIARQGDSIVVQLPGVTDRERAREIVGQTAELRFRPVLQDLGPEGEPAPAPPPLPLPEDDGGDPGEGEGGEAPPEGDDPAATPEGDDPNALGGGATVEPARHQRSAGPEVVLAQAADDDPAGDEPAPAGDPAEEDTPVEEGEEGEPFPEPTLRTTDRDDDLPEETVVLPDAELPVRYLLGPAEIRGDIVSDARAAFSGNQWSVSLEFTREGSRDWDRVAAQCFNREAVCPTGRLAIVLDGVVQSSPTIQTPNFGGRAEITGDFTQDDARDLALVLRFGSLPVQLETATEQSVSATLGRDSLEAGLLAGGIGLALVAVYLLAYYRMLGLVAIGSLATSGALLWVVISFLGERQGLALTLAGITGIIVSIGIAVDSNVVYYERVKEEVRTGRTLRSSVDRGFARAFSTILRADFASLIGAFILYTFTVGPVRGFAFFLGLATIIDVVVSWFFMRPAVILLGRSKRFSRARVLGVPDPVVAPVGAGGGA
jgi:preprotein translocase subunit SecD